MGVLQIVWRNFTHGSRTRRPDDMPPYPDGFRGMLAHDATRCTGCRTCAYVCSPGAITFDAQDGRSTVWRYFAGQCTFCARCVDYCPTQALSLERSIPAITGDPAQHHIADTIQSQACPRCSRPVTPLPASVLEKLYAGALTETARAEQKLCEDCRRKETSRHIRDGILGAKNG